MRTVVGHHSSWPKCSLRPQTVTTKGGCTWRTHLEKGHGACSRVWQRAARPEGPRHRPQPGHETQRLCLSTGRRTRGETGTRPRSRRGQEWPRPRGGQGAGGREDQKQPGRPAATSGRVLVSGGGHGRGDGAHGARRTTARCEARVGVRLHGLQGEAERCTGPEVQALLAFGLEASGADWRAGRGIRRFRAAGFPEPAAAVRERPLSLRLTIASSRVEHGTSQTLYTGNGQVSSRGSVSVFVGVEANPEPRTGDATAVGSRGERLGEPRGAARGAALVHRAQAFQEAASGGAWVRHQWWAEAVGLAHQWRSSQFRGTLLGLAHLVCDAEWSSVKGAKAFKSRAESWGPQAEGPSKDLILERPRRPQDIAEDTLTVDSPRGLAWSWCALFLEPRVLVAKNEQRGHAARCCAVLTRARAETRWPCRREALPGHTAHGVTGPSGRHACSLSVTNSATR